MRIHRVRIRERILRHGRRLCGAVTWVPASAGMTPIESASFTTNVIPASCRRRASGTKAGTQYTRPRGVDINVQTPGPNCVGTPQ